MDWLTTGEALIFALAVLAIAGIVALTVRRRWISRLGGVFECSMFLPGRHEIGDWELGVCRYRGESLEWFRAVSFSTRPTVTMLRSQTRAVAQRQPTPAEARFLLTGQIIVALENKSIGTREVSLPEESLTALLAWLEAEPPGLRYRRREVN